MPMTLPESCPVNLGDTSCHAYDYNGNATSKTDSTGTTNYSWDFENRLTSVTLPGSGGTISFKYDPFGRRIYKSSSNGTSIYAYDGDNLIEETNSSGTAVARYSDGLNIDEPLAMLRSAATSYYHADGLGSVTSLSNAAGALAQTYTFDSFGKQTASSGSLTNPFQYTARESDSETGLDYYRARYYDPSAGRFISEDPIRFEAGVNFYAYVRNNATGFRDPTGTKECGCNIDIRCHHVGESPFGIGIHCWFVAKDGDGVYHKIGAHALHDISGPIVVSNDKSTQPPNDPESWPIKNVPDPDCKKTKCLIDLTKLFTGLKLEYNWFWFNSTSVASQLAKGCDIKNVDWPFWGLGHAGR